MSKLEAQKHKAIKLKLINFLSNPDIKINYWRMDKDIEHLNPDLTNGYLTHKITGRGTLEIQFYHKEKK